MKIKTLGRAIYITLGIKLDDLKKAEYLVPECLTLLGQDKSPLFKLSTQGIAGINKYGATFVDEDAEGYACLTLTGEETATKDYILREVGASIRYIKVIEQNAQACVGAIESDLDSVFEDDAEPARVIEPIIDIEE